LLLAFGLPPVLQLAQVPPLRVIRRDVGKLKPASMAVLLVGVLGFAVLLLAASSDIKLGLIAVGGFAAAVLLFALASYGALRLLRASVNEATAPRWLVLATRQLAARPAFAVVQVSALAVGLLADTGLRLRMAARRPPVQVYALRETLKALREHIFNGVIWPDFTVIPSAAQPALAFVEVKLGQCLEVGGRHIEVLPAVHTVPAVGYAVSAGAGQPAWVFTGDTGPNPALWQRLAQMKVHTLVIETAFGDDEQALAQISQHLCPAMLETELKSLAAGAEVVITHIKPGELEAVMREIGAHDSRHRIRALAAGECLTVPGAG
jgi:hypothetical protein